MYVWQSQGSMYVCMYVWGSWACMYVCLTQSYKNSLFRRVSNSLSKPIRIQLLIDFFLNCEGCTSRSPARLQACMYVCMFELQTYPKHVCMSDRPKKVYMYVCLRRLSMYVCMSHSKLQNQLVSEGVKFLIKTYQNLMFNWFFFELWGGVLPGAQLGSKRVCMYVWAPDVP